MELRRQSCPYKLGDALELQVDGTSQSLAFPSSRMTAKILSMFEPITMSPVLLVSLEEHVDPLVLKLFDRRCTPRLREENGMELWSEQREKEYVEFVNSGQVVEFMDYLDNDYEEGTGASWTVSQDETSLQAQCHDLYTAESLACQTLQGIQGRKIPKLLETVKLRTCISGNSKYQEYLDIPGVLLEYIQGFNLAELDDKVPRECWQGICDDAISVVSSISDQGILNMDVGPAHFIVSSRITSSGLLYEPVMVDFAPARLRQSYESEEDWVKAKRSQDEEGAIGIVMRHKLEKLGFKLEYNPSYRYGRNSE